MTTPLSTRAPGMPPLTAVPSTAHAVSAAVTGVVDAPAVREVHAAASGASLGWTR